MVGLLIMIVFWGVLIFLEVWLANSLVSVRRDGGGSNPAQGPSAREILNQRYARGEISREQYELMKGDID